MSNWPKPDAATLLEIYRKATLIKQNDEHVIKQMMAGKLVMPYYSPRGQEIIPSAISVSLDDDDYICTIYRGIHDMLAKGFPLDEMWAELAGKVTGTCKGKGGPMHLTCPEKGMMVTTGIVGSSMPIATGLGWAAQLDGRNRVSVANFGDGATNIGAFHESMNMAAVWKLPVIFLCQNNHYAEHTAPEYSRAIDRISDRAAAYGMPGVTVDGNDPDEMYGAAKVAIERARAGEGPTLIEAMTFRFNGHIFGEAGHYMDKTIYAQAQTKDPMPVLRARLLSEGIATEADLVAIEKEVDSRIVAAIEAAMAADFPDVAELKRDVFAEEIA
ncbi:thiamine pyrophosphate-dependent dehydrogenase E1 component subunit alpha [Sphingobium sp. ZW T5_29]|uniref:thiamine pyrophosphate-dependent dehydrogenase E1 component subunit alpha n=1 Tax=Sphingobium sp. ZW T5_29 TaxID=3378077 RepID=UPI0038522C8F